MMCTHEWFRTWESSGQRGYDRGCYVTCSFARIASQADAHSVTLDCEVCGCYTANEREVDNELNALAKAVGGKVATNCGQAWCVAHTSVGAPS